MSKNPDLTLSFSVDHLGASAIQCACPQVSRRIETPKKSCLPGATADALALEPALSTTAKTHYKYMPAGDMARDLIMKAMETAPLEAVGRNVTCPATARQHSDPRKYSNMKLSLRKGTISENSPRCALWPTASRLSCAHLADGRRYPAGAANANGAVARLYRGSGRRTHETTERHARSIRPPLPAWPANDLRSGLWRPTGR